MDGPMHGPPAGITRQVLTCRQVAGRRRSGGTGGWKSHQRPPAAPRHRSGRSVRSVRTLATSITRRPTTLSRSKGVRRREMTLPAILNTVTNAIHRHPGGGDFKSHLHVRVVITRPVSMSASWPMDAGALPGSFRVSLRRGARCHRGALYLTKTRSETLPRYYV